MAVSILSLIGLLADIAGFTLIGLTLLKHPDDRPYLGGGGREMKTDRTGFFLVVVGFVFQAAAQVVSLVG